jgi:predicted dithiol-disulfide oxidoreductase (DUF899 family)
MVRVDKPYTFEGPDGPVGLLDLFEGPLQLVMHHFMLSPDWDTACPSCSSAADQIGRLRQLHVRNTTLVAVSRAPYAKLAAYRERMGWTFPWYSSYGSDFNYDFHATLDDRVAPVLLHFRTEAELAEAGTPWTGGGWTEDMRGEEMPGISAFLRVDDEVFHTYSTFGRGIEEFHNGYPWLDLTVLPPRRVRHLTGDPVSAAGKGRRIRPAGSAVGRAQRLIVGRVDGVRPAGVRVALLMRVEPVVTQVGGGLAADGAQPDLRGLAPGAVGLVAPEADPQHEGEHGDVQYRQRNDQDQAAAHVAVPPRPVKPAPAAISSASTARSTSQAARLRAARLGMATPWRRCDTGPLWCALGDCFCR